MPNEIAPIKINENGIINEILHLKKLQKIGAFIVTFAYSVAQEVSEYAKKITPILVIVYAKSRDHFTAKILCVELPTHEIIYEEEMPILGRGEWPGDEIKARIKEILQTIDFNTNKLDDGDPRKIREKPPEIKVIIRYNGTFGLNKTIYTGIAEI